MNVALAFGLWLLYRLLAAVEGWRVARRRQVEPVAQYQHWWACLLAAVVMYSLTLGYSVVVRAAWFEASVLPNQGMAETLQAGDQFLADKLWYRHQPIRHGEIVVFFSDGPVSYALVQRVIGLPGDVIELRDEVVYRNGQALNEPYAVREWDDRWSAGVARPETLEMPAVTVPEGEIFLIGDNRRRSADSRHHGPIPIADVVGPVMTIYWSKPPRPSPHGVYRPPGQPVFEDRAIRRERIGQRPR